MREIKFRFWDKKSDTMYPSFSLADLWDTVEVNNSLIPMQFTGLKDKNGVEIYEGDILKNEKSAKGNFFVKFNCGGYDAVYKGNFTLCLHPVLYDFDGAIIIGNIYQNSELL